MSYRPSVPEPVKRQLRQEAGFGCCKCGQPIIQYHHIIEWAVEQHFRPVDVMVLCPLHHDEATKQAMTQAEQRTYKAKPFNIERGWAQGPLKMNQKYCAVGTNALTLVGDNVEVVIDGEQLFGMSLGADQTLSLSSKLFDYNDTLIAQIVENEWISGDPMAWDIVADWQYLAIRQKARHVTLEIDARAIPTRLGGRLYKSGFELRLGDDALRFANYEDGVERIRPNGTVLSQGVLPTWAW
jgi:hypothetical protein